MTALSLLKYTLQLPFYVAIAAILLCCIPIWFAAIILFGVVEMLDGIDTKIKQQEGI